MKAKWLRYLPFALFPILFAFVSVSNIFDWDHFLASTESDLRSWMIWGEAPLWSYQFCGGVTRIGDPQAFGLSPFFIFNILFGAVWGWKIFIVASSALGFYFLEKIRKEFFPEMSERLGRLLIFSYLFGNFYLWHFHHGHLTFILHLWVLGLCYFYLRAVSGKFTHGNAAATAAIIFSIFSGGFYHTSVFFGLPLAAACVVHLLLEFKKKSLKFRPICYFLSALLSGILLSSYKWLAVIKYQMTNPRTVSSVELTSPIDMLLNMLIPTLNYKMLGLWDGPGPWAIWETSIFSLVPWILLVALMLSPKKFWESLFQLKSPGQFAVILGICSFVFYLGGDHEFYPFQAINHYLLNDSIRVVSRFGHDLVFSLLLLGFGVLPILQTKWVLWIGSRKAFVGAMVLIALNFFSFYPSLYVPLWPSFLTSIEGNPRPQMRTILITRMRTGRQSFMYEPVTAGMAVLNCYNPFSRGALAADEFSEFVAQNAEKSYPFIDFVSPPSEACLQGTYMTANNVVIDPACPRGCFSLNDLSESDKQKFIFDKDKKFYCTK